MEVFVDLDENLLTQNVIGLLQVILKLLISETAVSEGESALGVRHGINLIPMMRNESVVSESFLHNEIGQLKIKLIIWEP